MNQRKLKKVAEALRVAKKLVEYDLIELKKNAKHSLLSMLQTAIEAAFNFTSLEVIAEVKTAGPSADTVRGHLNAKLLVESVEGMLKDKLRWLTKLMMRKFGTCVFDIAVDCTDEMYYGDKNNPYVIGTKPQKGVSYAYKYFTASIVARGARYLLYAYPVFERGNLLFYLNRARIFVRQLGIRIGNIFMDREFPSVDVLAFLEEEKLYYLTPAKKDKKFKRKVNEVEKFPALFRGYQMENELGETVETNLVVLEKFEERKNGKLKRVLHGYLTNLPENFYRDDVEKLDRLYGKRWGIETGHRCEDEFRIKSTSKNGVVRYLYFVIGVLAYNAWVYANLLFCADMQQFRIAVKKDVLKFVFRQIFSDFRL